MNADGFGAGWYAPDRRAEPARYRSARPMWTDRSFASLAGVVSSGAVLAAVRNGLPGTAVDETNTHPFTSGPWLFTHNGEVDGFLDGVGTRLRRMVSDERLAGIEGSTDSEVLFALVLDRLDDGASPGQALADVVAQVVGLTTGRLNLALTDGRRVAATVCGDTLFVRRDTGRVMVASEPSDDAAVDTGAGWQRVDDGSLVEAVPGEVAISRLTLAAVPR
jgi:glutamine amidotransferase